MSVTKQILILITQIFFCVVCFAQREKIDSLKKVLPTLKDSARINCLNTLSNAYILSNKINSQILGAQVSF
jgi:hypothetical protein